MALRAKSPTTIQKRLKLLLSGVAGVGKTTAAAQFEHAYFIDCERGCEHDEYVDLLTAKKSSHLFTTDLNDVTTEMQSLLSEAHNYKTLVVDPITIPYLLACEESAKRLSAASKDPSSDGHEFGRNKTRPDAVMRHLLSLVLRIDMNVIFVTHVKPKWERIGNQLKDVGLTFDAYSKLDYYFDLHLELQRRGKQRVAIVRKTRLKGFPDGDSFPFSYDEIANRYGRDILERDAAAEKLASDDQVVELQRLTTLLKVNESTISKWLAKAGANDFSEMPVDVADKCIKYLQSQIKGNHT